MNKLLLSFIICIISFSTYACNRTYKLHPSKKTGTDEISNLTCDMSFRIHTLDGKQFEKADYRHNIEMLPGLHAVELWFSLSVYEYEDVLFANPGENAKKIIKEHRPYGTGEISKVGREYKEYGLLGPIAFRAEPGKQYIAAGKLLCEKLVGIVKDGTTNQIIGVDVAATLKASSACLESFPFHIDVISNKASSEARDNLLKIRELVARAKHLYETNSWKEASYVLDECWKLCKETDKDFKFEGMLPCEDWQIWEDRMGEIFMLKKAVELMSLSSQVD